MTDVNMIIQVSGVRELNARFNELSARGIENANKRAMRKTVNVALKAIRAATPVVTGVLRRGWTTKVSGGISVTGYVWVRDAMITPTLGAMRAVHGKASPFAPVLNKDGTISKRATSKRAHAMRRFMKPKNPYLYARRVEETSKANAGFYSETLVRIEPEIQASHGATLAAELTAETAKLGFRPV